MKNLNLIFFLKRTYLIVAILIFVCLYSKGQSYSQIIFDKQQSQYFGAYNFITLHHSLYSFEDKYIQDSLFKENNFIRKTLGFAYRMTKLFLLDKQIDGIIMLSQHEVFGHGSRFREFGFNDNSYNLNLSFPFGSGHGFAKYGNLQQGNNYPTIQENMAINIGGVDANLLLADNITNQILLDGNLHYRQGILYLYTQNNLLFYLWSTRYTKTSNIKPGNDMNNYINEANNLYSHSVDKIYNVKKLSNQCLVSLVNPCQIFSAISILYTYGIKGQKQLKKIPMIKFGNAGYLPALNYSLTPFGSQYHFINYVRYKQMLFAGDFNLGDNTFNKFYGFSIKDFNIINNKRVGLNLSFDIWNQPELERSLLKSSENKIGEAFKVDLMLRPLYQQNKLRLFLQTGYKTKGYIMGETLAESFILRYGISLQL